MVCVAGAIWLGRAWRATEPRASTNTGIRTLAVLPLELDPSNLSAPSLLITSAGELGRTDKAITEANLLVERFGRLPLTVGRLSYAHGRAGERQAAERLIAELLEMATQRYVSRGHLAFADAALGNRDRAFDALERAYDERSVMMMFYPVEPILE